MRDLNKYIHKNTREKLAKAKREVVRYAYKNDRENHRKNKREYYEYSINPESYYKSNGHRPSDPGKYVKPYYFTGNHILVCVSECGNNRHDMGDLRNYYDESFPTKKDIRSEIECGLEFVKEELAKGKADKPFGFEVVIDAALYWYRSLRAKLEGEESEPTGCHCDVITLATLTAEDVTKEL